MRRSHAALQWLNGDRGAAAVEFAIIVIPLVLLIVGVVDFGRALYTRNNIIQAADVGARVILLDNAATESAITARVHDAFMAAPDDELTVRFGTASESGIQFRTLSLAYEFDLLTPLLVVDRLTIRHSRRVPIQ